MAAVPTGKPDATPAAPLATSQQHTGNHDRPQRERDGNEKHGGSRAGAENVEPKH
jgi:hypothetical protein